MIRIEIIPTTPQKKKVNLKKKKKKKKKSFFLGGGNNEVEEYGKWIEYLKKKKFHKEYIMVWRKGRSFSKWTEHLY